MILRTYQAPTVEQALAKARAELGPGAIVLETRTVAPSGLLGFLRGPRAQVIVGVRAPGGAPQGRTPGATPRGGSLATEAANVRRIEAEIDGIRQALGTLGDEAEAGNRAAAAARAAGVWPSGPAPRESRELEGWLIGQGLDAASAAGLVEECRRIPAGGGSGKASDQLAAVLARRFATCGELHPSAARGPSVVALVGPPGGGKTTLLAKLAARFALGRGQKVALASVDFFRVGAVEQLQAYAQVLGLPFHFVPSPDEVPSVLRAARGRTWLLVDTPGLASHDTRRIARLGRWLAAFPTLDCHLALSAASDPPTALRAIDSYRALSFGRLAFAQLDEARRRGVLLLAAQRAAVPVSYLGLGQDVGEGIEVATAARLAAFVMGAA